MISMVMGSKGLCIPNHLGNKLLPRWLLWVEEPQESEKLALVGCVGHELSLLVDIDEEDAEVTP